MQFKVNPFCVRGQKHDFPSKWMVYLYKKCPGVCKIFFETSTWYLPIVYALFRSYLVFTG